MFNVGLPYRFALWRTENLTQESAQSIVETARHFETSGDTERRHRYAQRLSRWHLNLVISICPGRFKSIYLSTILQDGQTWKILVVFILRLSDDSRCLPVIHRSCVTAFQSALENTPTGSEAWFKRLMCFLEGLSAIGDYGKALIHASRGLEVAVSLEDPDARQRNTVDIMVHRAWVWRAQERTERARKNLRRRSRCARRVIMHNVGRLELHSARFRYWVET